MMVAAVVLHVMDRGGCGDSNGGGNYDNGVVICSGGCDCRNSVGEWLLLIVKIVLVMVMKIMVVGN